MFADLDELNRQVADSLVESARQAVAEHGLFTAALSGGSTPRPLYERMAASEVGFPWAATHLFQVDERAVPPESLDSNYRMIREALLTPNPEAARNFHRMTAESPDLERAAAEYSRTIGEILQPAPGAWPRFDFVLLGLGADGHTASLFPGTAALDESRRWVVPNRVEKLKVWRLTLTLPLINAARQVAFLVAGAEKAAMARSVLQPSSASESLPAQRVRPVDGRVVWYLDRAAASQLEAHS